MHRVKIPVFRVFPCVPWGNRIEVIVNSTIKTPSGETVQVKTDDIPKKKEVPAAVPPGGAKVIGVKLRMKYFFRKSRKRERKCHAHGYMDGGANICAESTQFSSAKNLFFADENEFRIHLRGYPFRRPCIHG